jgi:putative ABC transport system permease protein
LLFGDDSDMGTGFEIYLTALSDIHFLPDMQYDFVPKVSPNTLLILFGIAIIIIVIAAINFTNFSTALAPMRIKSINTQRVMGALRRTMRLLLVFEAVFISLLSYIVAIGLIPVFQDTQLVHLVDADLSINANLQIVAGTALVALLTGLLAGIYPSRFMTSFAPALVLKGSFGLSPKGKRLRNTLIGIQFLSSIVLIIGALFMYLQNYFMQNSDLGFQKDGIIVVESGRISKSYDAFSNQIKAHPGVDDITYSTMLMSGSDGYSKWSSQYRGKEILYQVFPVHYTFLDLMGIEVIEGRGFRQEDANADHGAFIFNESARKQLELELNVSFEGWHNSKIIGFVPDIKVASFRMIAEPTAFFVHKNMNWVGDLNYAYIKLSKGANIRDAMAHINTVLAEYDSNYPFEIRFFDEVVQQLYEKEISLSSLISLFSLIAIFISIVGVFGLVVFDSECRRKEIGIRKVFGATTTGIIVMFNKVYFKILVICFVVAVPIAWYAVNKWLQNFAYKTPIYWWVFLLAFVAVGVITIATVTFQNWRIANENPVNSILKG